MIHLIYKYIPGKNTILSYNLWKKHSSLSITRQGVDRSKTPTLLYHKYINNYTTAFRILLYTPFSFCYVARPHDNIIGSSSIHRLMAFPRCPLTFGQQQLAHGFLTSICLHVPDVYSVYGDAQNHMTYVSRGGQFVRMVARKRGLLFVLTNGSPFLFLLLLLLSRQYY